MWYATFLLWWTSCRCSEVIFSKLEQNNSFILNALKILILCTYRVPVLWSINLVTVVYSWAKVKTTFFASIHLHLLFLSYYIQNLQWLLCEFYVAEKHKVVPNCYVQTKQKCAMQKSQVSLLWYLLNKKKYSIKYMSWSVSKIGKAWTKWMDSCEHQSLVTNFQFELGLDFR